MLGQPVDSYIPDTCNYATLDVSVDGWTRTMSILGVNSYAGDTFLAPEKVVPEQ